MNQIKGLVAAILILVIGLLQYQILDLRKSDFGATIPTVVALFESSLASKVTSSATSMTLVTGTDKQGNSLSGTYGFIIDEGSANEEFVLCSATATALTSCTRGISVTDGKTAVTALQHEHRRGASVKITNYPQLAILSRILNGTEGIPNRLQYDSHPSFVGTAASRSLATVKYVDDVAIAGASNATTTVQGLVEQATVAELNAGTGTGGTGARLFIGPSEWASSSFAQMLYGNVASLSATNKALSRQNIWGSAITTKNKLIAFTLTASAQGDILYRNATGFVNLPASRSGAFLVTQGTGANPRWDTLSSGSVDFSEASDSQDFAPISATALTINLNKTARVQVCFAGTVAYDPNGVGTSYQARPTVDGSAWLSYPPVNLDGIDNYTSPASFCALSNALSAGSHTFRLEIDTTDGAAPTSSTIQGQFSVFELP